MIVELTFAEEKRRRAGHVGHDAADIEMRGREAAGDAALGKAHALTGAAVEERIDLHEDPVRHLRTGPLFTRGSDKVQPA